MNINRPGRSSDLDQEALREMVESSLRKTPRELGLDYYTFQSTVCSHMKSRKTEQTGRLASHSEKNKGERISIATSLLLMVEK